MPWQVTYYEDLSVIETRYEGIVSLPELRAAVAKTLEFVQKHNAPLLLADCSALRGGHSIVDLYDLVQHLDTVGVARGFREAVVLPELEAMIKEVKFWETAFGNRGFMVCSFSSRDAALQWLRD